MSFNLKENEFEFYAYWLDDMNKGGGGGGGGEGRNL